MRSASRQSAASGIGSRPCSALLAAIDIGSRNVKLVLGEPMVAGLVTSAARKSRLRLGDDVAGHGTIRRENMDLLRDVLNGYLDYCTESRARLVGAIATSAVRNAGNDSDVAALAEGLGIRLEIVAGRREAELAYLAATGGDKNYLVSDIGSRSCGIAWDIGAGVTSRFAALGHTNAFHRFFETAESWVIAEKSSRRHLNGCFSDIPVEAVQYIALAGKTLAGCVLGCDKASTVGSMLPVGRIRNKIDDIRNLSGSEYQDWIAFTPQSQKIAPMLVFVDVVLERSGHRSVAIEDTELPIGVIVEHLRRERM